jgi:metal-responsive CopG/Arc/MetJ family transcriptional regulator
MATDMEKKDVRIQLVISPSEVEALDEWRAKQRIWSRSEAIRRLIADGVAREKEAGGSEEA